MMRLSKSLLTAFLVLISLSALLLSASDAQSETTANNQKAYLPLIFSGSASPVGPVGGTFTSFAIDPGQNDNIYAGHFGKGVYKSFDQGNTWYLKSQGLGNRTIQSLATHPTSSGIVYAGTYGGGIYKSTNAGESWQASNGGVLTNHIIYDIEIDQSNPQRMFVVSRVSGSLVGYLSRSMDGGSSWTILLTGNSFTTPDYFYDVDIDPGNPSVVYLTAHEHGFYKSVNGGVSFSLINSGVTDPSARSFAIDPAYSGLVYGGVWHSNGVYRTWNAGVSWVGSSSGLPANVKVYRVYLDPFGRQQKRVFACTYGNGLYSSGDFGASWSSRGLAGQRIYDFMIADGNPQRWYAATESNGIFRSSSSGSNWNTIMSDLHLADITGLAVLPGSTEALAGSVYGQGVYRITDAGETWELMNAGLSSLDVLSLTVAGDQLYAIGRNQLDVWDGSRWQAIALPEASQEDLKAGEDWVKGRVLLPEEALWVEEASTVQPIVVLWAEDELLLGTAGAGLWTLNDAQWEQVGLDGRTVSSLAQSPDGAVWALACETDDQCGVFLVESTDVQEISVAAEALQGFLPGLNQLPLSVTDTSPEEFVLAVSPKSECVWAIGVGEKVWTTNDCGVSWSENDLSGSVQALAFDPVDPRVLIIGTRDSGAYKISVP